MGSKKLRICVVGPSYPYRGGISHYTSLLCRSLSTRHEVKLVSLKRQYPSLLFPGKTQVDRSDTAIRVEGAEAIIDSMNPMTWRTASKAIHQWQPDILIIQWWHPFFSPVFGGIARRAGRHTKVLFLCHNVLPHEQRGPVTLLSRAALQWGNLFIVHSEEDRRNLLTLIPNAEVRTARHPTYEVFNYREISRDEARQLLGVSKDEPLVLFFGLVRAYKGLKYLLEAMPKAHKETGARLLIAGEFYEDKSNYDMLVHELGISDVVTIHNQYVPNEQVAAYFAAADVVVLPYVTATQSGIVQIAYGFEKPVITTSVGGLPEAVIDGETGILVPPADSTALAEAITRFFRDHLSQKLSEGVRAHRDEFSWERMVETVEELAVRRLRG